MFNLVVMKNKLMLFLGAFALNAIVSYVVATYFIIPEKINIGVLVSARFTVAVIVVA